MKQKNIANKFEKIRGQIYKKVFDSTKEEDGSVLTGSIVTITAVNPMFGTVDVVVNENKSKYYGVMLCTSLVGDSVVETLPSVGQKGFMIICGQLVPMIIFLFSNDITNKNSLPLENNEIRISSESLMSYFKKDLGDNFLIKSNSNFIQVGENSIKISNNDKNYYLKKKENENTDISENSVCEESLSLLSELENIKNSVFNITVNLDSEDDIENSISDIENACKSLDWTETENYILVEGDDN